MLGLRKGFSFSGAWMLCEQIGPCRSVSVSRRLITPEKGPVLPIVRPTSGFATGPGPVCPLCGQPGA